MSTGALVFLILALVLLFNIALYFYAQRHQPGGQVALLQKAVRSMKDPFAQDNADLQELSRLVTSLQPDQPAQEAEGRQQDGKR